MNVFKAEKTGLSYEYKKWSGVILTFSILVSLLVVTTGVSLAHCDTMDGPLIADAKKALENNNVNYVLKWVPESDESEIVNVFSLAVRVRPLSPEAKELSEKYFFDILVRLHRAAEGMPFLGVRPLGTPVDEKIVAADKSIEAGNLSSLSILVPEDIMPELVEKFEKVMTLKDFDVDNVRAGREYVEAYVSFFKLAEGEDHTEVSGNENHAHDSVISH